MTYLHNTKSEWADGAALFVADHERAVDFKNGDFLLIRGNAEKDFEVEVEDDKIYLHEISFKEEYLEEIEAEAISPWKQN